jgi:CRP-like cAMP-binding protein
MPKIPATKVSRLANKDGDGRRVQNLILCALPERECDQFFASMEFVRLRLHQILHEAGEQIRSGYFLNDGMASVLTVQSDGKSVEVGLIGKEGFVGLPVIAGFKTSAQRIITQGDGTGYRLDVDTLRRVLPRCPELSKQLQQYALTSAMEASQIAACNRLHEVRERLARWLLMSHDRIQTTTMPLTQEFLGQMLGSRRASVSEAAGALQKTGAISYTRGTVTIVDRKKLEKVACDCYGIRIMQKRRWQTEAGGGT